jgi:hypothetical protein
MSRRACLNGKLFDSTTGKIDLNSIEATWDQECEVHLVLSGLDYVCWRGYDILDGFGLVRAA